MKYSNLQDIVAAVSDEFGIPADVLLTPQMRSPAVAHARHVAIYLACKLTWMSKDAIATSFNQKDHSSVFYGLNKISVLMTKDSDINEQIHVLTKKLNPQ